MEVSKSIHQKLLDAGISTADVAQLEDLCVHAVSQAYMRMTEITQSAADDKMRALAFICASELMTRHLRHCANEIVMTCAETVLKHMGGL